MNLIQTLRFTRLHRVFMTVFQFLRRIVCGRALRSDRSKREFVNLYCKIRAGSKMGQEGVFVLRSKRAEFAFNRTCGEICGENG